MATSPVSRASQEFRESASKLYQEYSIGMQALLSRTDFSQESQEDLRKTLVIIQSIAKSFFETAEQAQQLESMHQDRELRYFDNMMKTLISLKQKDIEQVRTEFKLLKEQAEFLQERLSNLPMISSRPNFGNEKITFLKRTHFHFQGRNEIFKAIQSKLISSVPLVLYGPPGIGKSETAIAYANNHLAEYSFVWTIEAATASQREHSYQELAEALSITIWKEDKPEKIRNKVHRKLESQEKPWLLIYDNLDELIELPQRGGHILITSRDKQPFPDFYHEEICPLSESESVEMFKKITGEADSQEMRTLAKDLGYYPILLHHVANEVRHSVPRKTIALYLSQLNKLDLSQLKPNDRYKYIFNEALIETLSMIPLEAVEWLKICSHLNIDRIPSFFLEDWLAQKENLSPDQKEKMTQLILTILTNRGLIRYNLAENIFSMHRFYQCLLLDEESFFFAVDFTLKEIGGIELEESILSNRQQRMQRALQFYEHIHFLCNSPFFSKIPKNRQVVLLKWLGRFYYFNGNYNRGVNVLERCLQILETSAVNNDSILIKASILNTIGSCLLALKLNVEKALEKYEETLLIRREVYGNQNHSDIADCINNIGNCFLYRYDYKKAIEKYEIARSIWEATLGKEHYKTAMSVYNIGYCLGNLGKYSEALKKFEEVLSIWSKTFGPDDVSVSDSLAGIANCLKRQGKYVLAVDKYKEVLFIQRRIYLNGHPYMLMNLNHLGECLSELKNYDLALKAIEEALLIAKKLQEEGSSRSNQADCLTSLGIILRDQEKYDLALEKDTEALNIRREIFGGRHPTLAISLNNIGASLRSQGKKNEAKQMFFKAYDIARETLGERSEDTQFYLKNFNLST